MDDSIGQINSTLLRTQVLAAQFASRVQTLFQSPGSSNVTPQPARTVPRTEPGRTQRQDPSPRRCPWVSLKVILTGGKAMICPRLNRCSPLSIMRPSLPIMVTIPTLCEGCSQPNRSRWSLLSALAESATGLWSNPLARTHHRRTFHHQIQVASMHFHSLRKARTTFHGFLASCF